MKKGEYLESIGLMTFANHQFLQGNADENYKKMAERLAENLVEIWNENEDREVCNMKEFIEKLIGRLEEYRNFEDHDNLDRQCIDGAIEIVNQLAEEYKDKSGIIDDLKIFLKEKFNYCAEQAGMNLEAECNSEIASYFRDRKELYLDRANIYGEVMREIDRLSEEHKGGWIPCSERLPESGIYVLCYGKNSLGSFKYEVSVYAEEIECWMCSKIAEVLAWQPLPEPYKEETT